MSRRRYAQSASRSIRPRSFYKLGNCAAAVRNSRSDVGSDDLIIVAGHSPHKQAALVPRIDDPEFFDCCFQR
jgi:hypothetical protein